MSETRRNNETDPKRVVRCPDGVYRWVYELDMYRNPVVLYAVLKVLGLSAVVVAVFLFLIFLVENKFSVSAVFTVSGICF